MNTDTPQLTAETEFDGTCPGCGKNCHYAPLRPRGRSRAYAPRLPFMNVRCGQCGEPVRLEAVITEPAAKTPATFEDEQAVAQIRQLAARGHTRAREILRLLAPEDADYLGIPMELVYAIADIIEQQVLETKGMDHWWTISSIARKGGIDAAEATIVLRWMVENKYIKVNGRGGCWVNYARSK